MSKYFKFTAIFAVLIAISAFVFFIGKSFNAAAEHPTYWVTIDENELKHLQTVAPESGLNFNFSIGQKRENLAIIQADELQLLDISRLMHQEYHKCSGFMSFERYEDAVNSIEETLRANANSQAITYTIDNQTNVNPMLAETQETQIRQVIIDLAAFPNRRYNQTSGMNSAAWIKDKWTALAAGRSDISVQYFTHTASVSPQPSVIMTVQGTTLPNEVVVLGAHQDSINLSGQTLNAPGADDDASGIATLTETIRVMVAKNFRPQRTVKFMAYSAEEVGLRGSADIAANYQTNSVNVVGVMQLDMTNYKGSAVDIVLINDFTNAAQNTFVANLVTTYQPTLTVTNDAANGRCGYACSDHASWFNKGFATSMPFEARFASGVSEDNPYIHTLNDTLDKSNNNANHALKFAKLALSYVGELAKGSIVSAAPIRSRMDYDGDSKTDVSVFRPDTGNWYLNQSQGGFASVAFGQNGDKIVPADYDGDGKTDVAVFRNGNWYLNRSQAGFTAVSFGTAGDIPVPEDYDGDGKADVAVYRPSVGAWYLLKSTEGFAAINFGILTDKPVAADYDGDNKADVAVYRDGNWYILQSQQGFKAVAFGTATDKPVNVDFDGDNKADISVYRDGNWYQLRSTAGFNAVAFGTATDKPAVGDFDGDGKDDVAVYRPSNGVWYILNSSNGNLSFSAFGISTDIPTTAAYQQ
ncbi:MAG TPA: M20/M25/M40 family metallo-hydrolase [Pyrinomonadaceae bacterium]|nr:M20/M25/M40 family metallo-hydrolase [Pyrinomonadaceae bacterium]